MENLIFQGNINNSFCFEAAPHAVEGVVKVLTYRIFIKQSRAGHKKHCVIESYLTLSFQNVDMMMTAKVCIFNRCLTEPAHKCCIYNKDSENSNLYSFYTELV